MSRSLRTARRRRAATLSELLVALGILGLLVSLLLPAVQNSREAARRLTCNSRLRQIGLSLHGHQAALGALPRGGDMLGTPGVLPRLHAPHLYLLPYLDEQPLYDRIDLQIIAHRDALIVPGVNDANEEIKRLRVPVFLCPSDPGSGEARNHYRANIGATAFPRYSNVEQQTPRSAVAGAFFPVKATLRPPDFQDGLSQTVAFSEKSSGDWSDLRFTPSAEYFRLGSMELQTLWASPNGDRDFVAACGRLTNTNPAHESTVGGYWFYADFTDTWYNHLLTPNHPTPDCGGDFGGVMTARSAHAAGVNVVMMDGSTRFVSDGIAESVWHALGTRAAGDTDSSF